MSPPMILRHDTWPGLIAELARVGDLSHLLEIPVLTACAVLAAPAAIARWIALRAPQLARAGKLSVLVIGAETVDASDQGRWYQLVPAMLDAASEVEATLVGPELDLGFTSAAAVHAPVTPARRHRVRIAEFLARRGPVAFDIAAVFQPGLQKHRGWLGPDGFPRLIEAGVPLMGSSYEVDEYEMERWVLQCHGYRVSAEPVVNPFVLELGDAQTAVRWGRTLWAIEAPPPAGAVVDQRRLDALDNLTRMVMHTMTHARVPCPAYGTVVELTSSDNQRVSLVHIFDRRFVDMASGRTVHLLESGEVREASPLPAEALAAYPGAHAREIERAVWAAGIKSRYLLDSYAGAALDSENTAREMLAAMRAKAAALFK